MRMLLLLLLLSGTPGRVYDMISRRALKLDDVKLFVLDEADEMLSRGFKEQIYDGNVCMLWWMYKCMYVLYVCIEEWSLKNRNFFSCILSG
jgi:hypothetical protein